MTVSVRPLRVELDRSDLALLAIIGLGLALRLIAFTGLGFADDPDYAGRAYGLLHDHAYAFTDNNGLRIGTWYPAALGYALFGINAFGLVCYPLVMSIAGIVVVARLGAQLFDRPTGLVAALLLAFYPLDVELATRLLPDALLAAWTAVAIALLIGGDLAQHQASGTSTLVRRWYYVLAGAAFGWCAAVNMSSVVVVPFLLSYFVGSTIWLARHTAAADSLYERMFVLVGARAALIALGFLIVAGPEAFLYWLRTGHLLAKYVGTFSHYNDEGRAFVRDLWFYPGQMFFLQRDWRIVLPPPEYRPYGFFFIAAVPALAYGLWTGGNRFGIVALWLLGTFAYLEWGSMSLRSWNFLHRLDRHLELVTPPLILTLAFACRRLASRPRGTLLSAAIVIVLAVTSWATIVRRHAATVDQLALMEPVHAMLEVLNPPQVLTDTQTGAYQRFLDRYDNRRTYLDIANLPPSFDDEKVALMVGEDGAPGSGWRLAASLDVPTRNGPPRPIRAYIHPPLALEALDLSNSTQLTAHLRRLAPSGFLDNARIAFYWEGTVDGVDRISLRSNTATSQHVAFNLPTNVNWRSYEPIVESGVNYTVIKEAGRGDVKIVDPPTPANGGVLTVTVDDGSYPGAGRYRWFLVTSPER